MAASDRMLGLYLGVKTVQAVEIEREGPSPMVLAIDEWENTLDKTGEDGEKRFLDLWRSV